MAFPKALSLIGGRVLMTSKHVWYMASWVLDRAPTLINCRTDMSEATLYGESFRDGAPGPRVHAVGLGFSLLKLKEAITQCELRRVM